MKCPRIIIVEDNKDIRELCRLVLEIEGFTVETCENGKEALLSLDRNSTPCLVLLDMLMPIMGGREFMAQLSKRPHTIAPIPVYLVSATAEKEDARKMGCIGFIKKPFNLEAFIAIVKQHCQASELKKAA
jgi:CheY-like chemotaxis protein